MDGSAPIELDVPRLPIVGLPIAALDCHESARLMVASALARRGTSRRPLVITSANGQVLSMCARDPRLRELFLAADLIHADGMPLVFASRLRSSMALPERVATTDLFHDVARAAQSAGATFYLLGGAGDVNERVVQRVEAAYPQLVIAGARHGYFPAAQTDAIIDEIDAIGTDVLWIGMGVPRELELALRFRARARNIGVIKTAGGLFDFLSGKNRRAPRWMQAAGIEWLFRLVLEPRRLLLRYLTTNPHALYLLLTDRSRLPNDRSARARLHG